jgi:hypothetical protein
MIVIGPLALDWEKVWDSRGFQRRDPPQEVQNAIQKKRSTAKSTT